jgi:hypothetical protein
MENKQLQQIFNTVEKETQDGNCKSCLFCCKTDSENIYCCALEQDKKFSTHELERSNYPCGPCQLGLINQAETGDSLNEAFSCLAYKFRKTLQFNTVVSIVTQIDDQRAFMNNLHDALKLQRQINVDVLGSLVSKLQWQKDDDRRLELLKHYNDKPVSSFTQYDGFAHISKDDYFMDPDADGDCLSSKITQELMTGNTTVRVLIAKGTKKDDVIRLLGKLLDFVKEYQSDVFTAVDVEDSWGKRGFVIKEYTEDNKYHCCPACGEQITPKYGPELFEKDSMTLVCWNCGEKYAPDLIKMLKTYHSNTPKLTYNSDRLSIKWNNCATNDPCAICGARTDPIVGFELFERDSLALVCHQCGRKYAPELTTAVENMQPIPDDIPF